jgi:hypothetical protein
MIEAVHHIMGIEDGLHALDVTQLSISDLADKLVSYVDSLSFVLPGAL